MANQQELIDQYHSGQMTPDQMVDFEKQLASNSELKAESDFQSDIINGLKEVRKAELKARLNSIEIGSSWVEFAMQSSLVKSFGGVAVATLIGSGVYLYAEKEESLDLDQRKVEIVAPMPEDVEFNFEQIVSTHPIEKAPVEQLASTTITDIVEEPPVTATELSKESRQKSITPDFNAPSANMMEDDSKFQSSDLEALPGVAETTDKKIDVTTENVNSVDIKYKYYDGKLFLSGDFDRAPYEILEINSAKGRRIYIQYLNKYYKVETSVKLTKLPEVNNQALIKELELLKENK